jgi:hypothetical protein
MGGVLFVDMVLVVDMLVRLVSEIIDCLRGGIYLSVHQTDCVWICVCRGFRRGAFATVCTMTMAMIMLVAVAVAMTIAMIVAMVCNLVSMGYMLSITRWDTVSFIPCKKRTLIRLRPKPTHPMTKTSFGFSTSNIRSASYVTNTTAEKPTLQGNEPLD